MLPKLNNNFNKSFIGGSGANLRLVISENEKYVVKSIERSEERASKLAAQYEWLKSRKDLDHIVKVQRLHHEGSSARYTMEFLDDYVSLSDYFISNSACDVGSILTNVLNFLETKIHTNKASVVSKNLMNHYIEKKLFQNIRIAGTRSLALDNILKHDEVIINGKRYKNFDICYSKIISNHHIIKNTSKHSLCEIHGDLTLENIFINEATLHFVLIDPNCQNLISSPMIDYSKLLQSTSSKYEVMKNLLLQNVGNEFLFDETGLVSDHITLITNEILQSKMSTVEYKNLSLFEAINFSRILPYRLDLSPKNYLLYYCRMIILLNRYIEEYE